MQLLVGERIDLDAHGFELEAGDLAVDLTGDGVDLLLELVGVLGHVFGGERLIGEGHVHDGGGVTFGRGQIDQAAFTPIFLWEDIVNYSAGRRTKGKSLRHSLSQKLYTIFKDSYPQLLRVTT